MFSLALTWLPQSHWVAEGQYQLFLKSDSSLSLSSMRCTAVYVPRDRWAAWARASASPSVVCWRAGESLPWKKPRRLASPRFLWRLRRGMWRMLWRIAPCWAASWPLAYRDLSPQWYQFINWPRFYIYLWLFFFCCILFWDSLFFLVRWCISNYDFLFQNNGKCSDLLHFY